MDKRENAEFDRLLGEAWDEVRASKELKASTLDAVHASGEDTAAPAATCRRHDPRVATGRSARRVPSGSRRRFIPGLIAAVLCLVVVASAGNALYHTETAYASIGGQTGVTLSVNRFGTCIGATADDADSQAAIDALGLSGRDYAEAVGELLRSGLLSSDEVDVTVSAEGDGQERDLVETSVACLSDAGRNGTCNGNRYGQGTGSGQGGNGAGSGSGRDSSGGTIADGMTGNGQGAGGGAGQGTGAGSSGGKRYGRN